MTTRKSWFKIILFVTLALALLLPPVLASAQETNGITAPEDGATISGMVDVKGYADDPSFSKWQLDILPDGDAGKAIAVTVGDESGEFSYSLDSTAYPDGAYTLRLRVVRSDANYDEYATEVTIANAGESTQPAAAPAEDAATEETATDAVADETVAEEAPAAAPAAEEAMSNGITAPEDGATISGMVDVKGYADDPSFNKWQLDILPDGDAGKAIFVALGEDSGEFSYSLDSTPFADGAYTLRLRVVRSDGNYDEYATEVTIANAGESTQPAAAPAEETAADETAAEEEEAPAAAPAAEEAMPNGVTAPKDGAEVSGTVDVKGYADDPNFTKWQLDILPDGDAGNAIFVALGEDSGEFSYSLDTTPFADGAYTLRLRVVHTDGNYDEYTSDVTITNAGESAQPAAAAPAEEAAADETAAAAEEAPAAAPAAEEAMPNGVTAPKDGAEVSGTIDVKGYADDPNFSKWQLDILPDSDAGKAIFVALGEDSGEFSYSLDSTAYPDDAYTLRLRVVRSDGNYDEYTIDVTIANS